jgi:hypothetical protein
MVWTFRKLPFALSILLIAFGFGVLSRTSFADVGGAQWAGQFSAPATPAYPPSAQSAPPAAPKLSPPQPPSPGEALKCGVLIVVSIPSQRLYVFKDGDPWGETAVSTGRRGYGTPVGVFPILQKQVHHRSSTYYGAPMPYMQRLTWGGVALHAGHVTGRPASHGCIRLPWNFAQRLYALTSPASTAVIVSAQPLEYAQAARALVGGGIVGPPPVRQAGVAPLPPAVVAGDGRTQTIQLAAAADARSADSLWQELSQRQPELQALSPVIVPAVVRSVQVYRLRASGSEAFSICSRLMARGVACMKVIS